MLYQYLTHQSERRKDYLRYGKSQKVVLLFGKVWWDSVYNSMSIDVHLRRHKAIADRLPRFAESLNQ